MRLWSGQAFGIDAFLKGRKKGSTATYCPACPEIGFNVSRKEVWDADERWACVSTPATVVTVG